VDGADELPVAGRGDEPPGVFDCAARRLVREDFDMMALVSKSGRSKCVVRREAPLLL